MANIYKNAKLDLTTNTVVTLYTVPSDSRAIIKSILVSDDTNNGSSITVDLFNGPPASASKSASPTVLPGNEPLAKSACLLEEVLLYQSFLHQTFTVLL